MDLYGSFATDLSIESSDVDITIKFVELNESIDFVVSNIVAAFKEMKLFENVNPILTASVPVIKLVIDPHDFLPTDSEESKAFSEFKASEMFRNYKFDLADLLKLKVDITFSDLSQKDKIDNTNRTVEWAKATLTQYPEIKPIIHILKRYLQTKRLNSTFNGRTEFK